MSPSAYSCKLKTIDEAQQMKQISVINSLIVPPEMVDKALEIREVYMDYFRKQPGFVSATFYKSINADNQFNYINIVVWESLEAFQTVVNKGFENEDGLNEDNMKVLGKGFPEPIKIAPGQYEVIAG